MQVKIFDKDLFLCLPRSRIGLGLSFVILPSEVSSSKFVSSGSQIWVWEFMRRSRGPRLRLQLQWHWIGQCRNRRLLRLRPLRSSPRRHRWCASVGHRWWHWKFLRGQSPLGTRPTTPGVVHPWLR